MAAEFVHETQDFLVLHRLLLKQSRIERWAPVLCGILVGIASAVGAGWTPWSGRAGWPILVAAALGWLLYRLLAGPLGYLGVRLQAEVMFRLARREGLLVPHVELTSEGLRTTSEKGETLTRWSGVREVVRTEEHVFIFVSSKVAFMAPRRVFESYADFEAFASEAAERHCQATGRATNP